MLKKKSHPKYPSTHTTVLQRHNISHKDTIDTYNQTYHLSLSTKSGFVASQSNIKAFPVTITFLSLLSLGFHVTFIPPPPPLSASAAAPTIRVDPDPTCSLLGPGTQASPLLLHALAPPPPWPCVKVFLLWACRLARAHSCA